MTDLAPALRRILQDHHFEMVRRGKGDHEIWRNTTTGRQTVVDGKIKSRHTANAVLKQAGLPKTF
ncbi:HicA toxin of toxin-antitoxin [Rhizobiales bacterium GAS191]|nr:HicA toxin of toxin-antitoxin [Rhizobiales bacterium GAS113]SEC62256.1 HicA toxin of toxin-antitoxin [Rhizobiales bacterium GAS188]SEC66624.1 HicA toxin of toxin-antitoxin [Rhizobiales bacterium GAS191]